MKLTYWVSKCLSDDRLYSVRGRRRKDVVAELETMGLGPDGGQCGDGNFGPVTKVAVEYSDAFDLLESAMGDSISETAS